MGVGKVCKVSWRTTGDFSVEMGRRKETRLVAKKGQSTFCWEKLLEETRWVAACDLKRGL